MNNLYVVQELGSGRRWLVQAKSGSLAGDAVEQELSVKIEEPPFRIAKVEMGEHGAHWLATAGRSVGIRVSAIEDIQLVAILAELSAVTP